MRNPRNAVWWQGYREIGAEDVAYIRTFAQRFPGLSRKELTYTLCEHREWLIPAGRPKFAACSKLIFAKPLQADFRGLLCSNQLKGASER